MKAIIDAKGEVSGFEFDTDDIHRAMIAHASLAAMKLLGVIPPADGAGMFVTLNCEYPHGHVYLPAKDEDFGEDDDSESASDSQSGA